MKRFNAIDLSVVSPGQRTVLSITLPELLTLYCRAKPTKRPELREYRLKKWREQFAGVSAWDVATEHICAMVEGFDAQGYAGCTINREIADIGGCYSWAILKRHCPGWASSQDTMAGELHLQPLVYIFFNKKPSTKLWNTYYTC